MKHFANKYEAIYRAAKRRGLFTNSGFAAYDIADPVISVLSQLQFETKTPWDSVWSDAYTFRFAVHYLRENTPRVLYLSLGEMGDWAHNKRHSSGRQVFANALKLVGGSSGLLWANQPY